MNSNKMKLVYWLAFILCGGISCWATGESLCLLSKWPLIICYLVAIAFFMIASYGTKLLIDSFGRDVKHPWLQLFGGIILVLIFWAICSMPTNTHTFFMRSQGKELITQDISTTKKYLTNIKNYSGDAESEFELASQQITLNAENFKEALRQEICGRGNPGNGERTLEIIQEYNNKYGFDIAPNSKLSLNAPEEAFNSYATRIDNEVQRMILDKQKEIIGQLNGETAQKAKEAATTHIQNLDRLQHQLQDGVLDVTDKDDLDRINTELEHAYSLIKANQDKAALTTADKERYTADNIQTATKRLTSISEMIKDWWDSKYKNFGLGWWIFLSVLIDISAFIFFYLANRKTSYFQ